MKIAKIRDVKTPTRGTSGSAGLDFYIPNDMVWDGKTLMPGESVVIPSGIIANVPSGYALIAFNKSGIATKKGLQVGACVIDEDYQGEIHIHLTNISRSACHLLCGEKIVQFLLIPICYTEIEEVEQSELFAQTTKRGTGAFGSTGNK